VKISEIWLIYRVLVMLLIGCFSFANDDVNNYIIIYCLQNGFYGDKMYYLNRQNIVVLSSS